MKVRELVELLSQCDPETLVVIRVDRNEDYAPYMPSILKPLDEDDVFETRVEQIRWVTPNGGYVHEWLARNNKNEEANTVDVVAIEAY